MVDPALRPLGIESRDWSIEGGIAQKLIETPLTPAGDGKRADPARTLTIGARIAHREQLSFLLGEPFSFSPGSVDGRTKYTALRLTADYVERGISQVFALSLTGTQGLDGTRSPQVGIINPDRDFRIILIQASYARRLTKAGLEIRARMAAQYADGPLYSGERFSAGGENSVRGYRENLLLADGGGFGSLELAQPFSLTGSRRAASGGADWGAFTASAFLDGARLNNKAGPDPAPRSIASVGASIAWTPSDAIFARLTYGEALKDARIVGKRDMQDKGFQFRITIRPLAWLR